MLTFYLATIMLKIMQA